MFSNLIAIHVSPCPLILNICRCSTWKRHLPGSPLFVLFVQILFLHRILVLLHLKIPLDSPEVFLVYLHYTYVISRYNAILYRLSYRLDTHVFRYSKVVVLPSVMEAREVLYGPFCYPGLGLRYPRHYQPGIEELVCHVLAKAL